MLKVLKNEIIKMVSGKKFYVLSAVLIISIVSMAVMGSSDPEYTMTANNFLIETLFGMLMKPIVPMFMVLVIAETLTEDYTHGTMKFSLMTPIKKSDFIIGKLLFIALYALIFLIIGFVGSYIVGTITFGLGDKGEFLNNFINNVKVYASVTLPLVSFSVVVSFIALLINNSGAVIGLGIGIDVIMMMIDAKVKNAVYFTFSGGMYACKIIPNLDIHNILILSMTACAYIVVFSLLSIIAVNKKDIVL